MAMLRVIVPIVCVLGLTLPSTAATVTVSQTLTYQNNVADVNGPFFMPPGLILDHPPYYRGAWEDWGWTHDVTSLVPVGAAGILSATLKIRTWDVADVWSEDYFNNNVEVLCPEDNRVYAILTSGGVPVTFKRPDPTSGDAVNLTLSGTLLGSLDQTGVYTWGATTFSDLPSGVLAELWTHHTLRLFMNIDTYNSINCGHRVSIAYSMLTVTYLVPDAPWDYDLAVYRFWSPGSETHFYTTNDAERDKLINRYSDVWAYEGVVYHTYPDKRSTNLSPVYRFWSSEKGSHFYTISEGEKDKMMGKGSLIDGIQTVWTYEGIAFYAHPEGQQPVDALPVYRFWSPVLEHHFYTISESEKNKLINRYSDVWTYEGIAWYAYP
jgi:hypothetical protein